jgi:putative endonuclease
MKGQHFFVYITTNPKKSVLYTGVTNDLTIRIEQHYQNRGNADTFAGKFHCYRLVYLESFPGIEQAISREKEMKGWTRAKKESLITAVNPNWNKLEV